MTLKSSKRQTNRISKATRRQITQYRRVGQLGFSAVLKTDKMCTGDRRKIDELFDRVGIMSISYLFANIK